MNLLRLFAFLIFFFSRGKVKIGIHSDYLAVWHIGTSTVSFSSSCVQKTMEMGIFGVSELLFCSVSTYLEKREYFLMWHVVL